MRSTLLAFFIILSIESFAQADTVVVQYDSTFMSIFARRLNDKRTALKYHMEEFGNIRNVAVYLSTLEEILSGRKIFGVRIDTRMNRNLFTDAPLSKAEYIDEDEIDTFIERLEFIQQVTKTDVNAARYTEYRFYTRSGIALECYTGSNRWRVLLLYELNKTEVTTYLNNDNRLTDLIEVLQTIKKEIENRRANG
jgi:hypothetical protein